MYEKPSTQSCRVMPRGLVAKHWSRERNSVLDNPFHRTDFSRAFADSEKAKLKLVLLTEFMLALIQPCVSDEKEIIDE